MKKLRLWLPLLVLLAGTLALWPLRHQLTAEAIARRSPEQSLLAAGFLVALYAVKSLSIAFPLSALTAAGGLLFPFPMALAVNLAGVCAAQTVPYLLGRREQDGLEALTARYPRLEGLNRAKSLDWPCVFLLRLAGASPGDVVSLYLGAAGVSWGIYLSAGLLGSLPRVAATTLLGSALWDLESPRFWASLGLGWAMTVLSAALWKIWR